MDKSALEREALMEIISKLEGMAGEAAPKPDIMSEDGFEMATETENPTGALPEADGMTQENSGPPSMVIGADDKPPMRERKMMDMGGKGAPKMDIKAVMMKGKLKR